jgi:hypothetical protein
MKAVRILSPLLLAAVVLGAAVTLTMSALATGPASGATGPASGLLKKAHADPEQGKSDAERKAIHAAARARNDAFLREFVASGRDPHSLEIVEVPTWAAPPSLSQARSASDAIVFGKVKRVTFEVNSSGGLPLASATVTVIKRAKGLGSSELGLLQLGGPVWNARNANGGALAQLDNDPLVLPNDEVILMLTRNNLSGRYRPVLGVGVTQVRANTVFPHHHNPLAPQLQGLGVDDALALLAGH